MDDTHKKMVACWSQRNQQQGTSRVSRTCVVATTLIVLVLVSDRGCEARYGPGSAEWETDTPESVGLQTEALDEAEQNLNAQVSGRSCYVVIKDGKLVYEKYRLGRNAITASPLYSMTKSACAAVFGLAELQGWVNTEDKVSDKIRYTRFCNNEATFENVLTMTGQSGDLSHPKFLYDATGNNCLDTIGDMIWANNPQNLPAHTWMYRNWQSVMGLKYTYWDNAAGLVGGLPCGYGLYSTCRDVARIGQLWANNGSWGPDGDIQLMNESYAKKAQTSIFPSSTIGSSPYGYLMWLFNGDDDIDPHTMTMAGLFGQCGTVSRKLNTVVVSLGVSFDPDMEKPCGLTWTLSKDALAGKRVPANNAAFDEMIAVGSSVGLIVIVLIVVGMILLTRRRMKARLHKASSLVASSGDGGRSSNQEHTPFI